MPVTTRVIRVSKAVLPKEYKLGKPAWRDIGTAVGDGIAKNVLDSTQAGGQPIKKNTRKWTQQKADNGHDTRSLIMKDKRFVKKGRKSYDVKADAKSATVGFASGKDRKLIGVALQKKGYVGWFDMPDNRKDFAAEISKILKKAIHALWKAAGAGKKV